MTDYTKPSEPKKAAEIRKARKKRNRAVVALVFGLAVLFYVITIARMSV
jgi:hypothetical protein